MTVGRISIRSVDLAETNETVWQAAERMHQRTVGLLIVVDQEQRPVGVLTDRDIVERVVAQGRDAGMTTIGQVMTVAPTTVEESASIESALALMRAHAVRRLPVVDSQGQLVAVISLDDVLVLLAEEFAEVGRLLEKQTPAAAAGVA